MGVILFGFVCLLFLALFRYAFSSRPYTNGYGVHVVDGDTLVVKRQYIRIWGVDSPEIDQHGRDAKGRTYPVGVVAAQYLRALIGECPVDIEVVGKCPYGRTVARCYVKGMDLGASMVASGFAFDYRRYSGGTYKELQLIARRDGLGMWCGEVEHPTAYRIRKNCRRGKLLFR